MNFRQPTKKAAPKSTAQLPVVNPNAAGIDLGSSEHFVSVPPNRCAEHIRSFKSFTPDLREMVAWLKECEITSVAMEATGVYWMPVFDILEEAGFEVFLVDARKTKNVSGRKTDVKDAEWIRQLHSFGLLAPAFVPPLEIRVLRNLWRQRQSLVEQASRQILLMQKSLDLMNLHLHKVLSDITGVSGMSIIRAILAGERDPDKFILLLQKGVKGTPEEFQKALTGNYRPEYLFCLGQAVRAYEFFQMQIRDCDRILQEQMKQFEQIPPPDTQEEPAKPQEPSETTTTKVKKAPEPPRIFAANRPESKDYYQRKNQLYFDIGEELKLIFGVELTAIEGISVLTAQTILVEIGTDLSRFPTAGHFASWMGLAPNNRITGGQVKSRRTRKVRNRVADALRRAAQSLHHSHSALGAFLRRMKAKLGMPKAITATARKLAERVYGLIRHGGDYVMQGAEEYEEKYKQRKLAVLKRMAQEQGLDLVEQKTGRAIA